MLGMLAAGQADIIVMEYMMSVERQKYVDFTTTVSHDYAVMIAKATGATTFFRPWQPYTITMWVAIIISTCVFIAIYYYTNFREIPLSKCILWMIGSQLGQAIPIEYKVQGSLSNRILLLAWCTLMFFVVAGYKCNLTAIFSLQKPQADITSFREAMNIADLKVYAAEGSSVLLNFRLGHTELDVEAWRRISSHQGGILHGQHDPIAGYHIINSLEEQKAVFTTSKVIASTLLEHVEYIPGLGAGLYILNEPLYEYGACFPIRKGFIHKDAFNREINNLLESGMYM